MPAVIRKYIYNYEDFTDYYLCLCDELGQRQKEHVSHYTDKMHLRVGFHNREVMSAPGENLDIDFGKPDVAAWGQLEISADGKEWQKVDFKQEKNRITLNLKQTPVKAVRFSNVGNAEQEVYLRRFMITLDK